SEERVEWAQTNEANFALSKRRARRRAYTREADFALSEASEAGVVKWAWKVIKWFNRVYPTTCPPKPCSDITVLKA
ncbi:hypothetical protein ACFL0T_02035, partial [Candidatus Omnitrophota bacterium]